MKILVTGAAGFIGFHLSVSLLKLGHEVVGIDNLNDYYDPTMKTQRLAQLGVSCSVDAAFGSRFTSSTHPGFQFVRLAIEDRVALPQLFEDERFDVVCNLAAQAGVRYSLENPFAYVDANLVGFVNILEACRHYNVRKLVYASSSSVYGTNEKVPFATDDTVDHPISLYAATKKSNELMAHTYSHLFGIETIGLRFFTVYGPWGRPDMAMFLFTDAILNDRPIDVFNNGELARDFTYIDDIVAGVAATLLQEVADAPQYRVYNIGNSRPVALLDFISGIEKATGKTAQKNFLPMQPGDVTRTWADVDDLKRDYGYAPSTDITFGVSQFVNWYRDFYHI